MNEIKKGGLVMSFDGPYLDWHCLNRLQGEPFFKGDVAGEERGFSRVIGTEADFWCDHITGQLYNVDTLTCLSSPRLVITNLRDTGKRVPKIAAAKRGSSVKTCAVGDE